jgi:hypothetical protein
VFEIEAALEFTEEHWPKMLPELEVMRKQKKISFEYLWAIMAPGTPVYGIDQLGEPRLWFARDIRYARDMEGNTFLKIEAWHTDSDGERLGIVVTSLKASSFDGTASLREIQYAPFHEVPDRQHIWKYILARTQKQLAFHGGKFKVQEQTGFGLIQAKDNYGARLAKFKVIYNSSQKMSRLLTTA